MYVASTFKTSEAGQPPPKVNDRFVPKAYLTLQTYTFSLKGGGTAVSACYFFSSALRYQTSLSVIDTASIGVGLVTGVYFQLG